MGNQEEDQAMLHQLRRRSPEHPWFLSVPVLLVIALFLWEGTTSPGLAQADHPEGSGAIVRILGDRALWDKDCSSALAALPVFQKAGDIHVVVLPDRIAGEKTFANRQEAEEQVRALANYLRAPDQRFEAALRLLSEGKKLVALKPMIVDFQDDHTMRAALVAPAATLLRPDLTIKEMADRLGRPGAISTSMMAGTKSSISTCSYVNGVIGFVASGNGPQGYLVNRVVLKVPAVVSALLQTSP